MKKFHYYKYEIQIRSFSFVFCFLFLFFIIYFYATEYTWLLSKWLIYNQKSEFALDFQCTEISEAFQTYINISFIGAFFYNIPLTLYHTLCFFAPGFYQTERKHWIKHIWSICGLFSFGLFFGFKFILGLSWYFFSHLEIHTSVLNVQFEPRILNTVNFVFLILTVTIIFCQLPYIFYMFLYTNKIHSGFFSKNRSYIYMFSVLICSFLSPPDLYLQSIFILINFLFIEFFIFVSFLFKTLENKKRLIIFMQ